MPGPELVKEIFKRKKIKDKDVDDILVKKINKRKEQIFKEIQKVKHLKELES